MILRGPRGHFHRLVGWADRGAAKFPKSCEKVPLTGMAEGLCYLVFGNFVVGFQWMLYRW